MNAAHHEDGLRMVPKVSAPEGVGPRVPTPPCYSALTEEGEDYLRGGIRLREG